MRKVFVEYTYAEDKYTGIGKTISLLCSAIENSGCEVIKLSRNNCTWSANDFYYYNVFLPRYCKKNLCEEDIFLIPNNMSKFWFLPHSCTWVLMHDIIPLSRFGYTGLRKCLYIYKTSKLKYATKIITISETVKKQLNDRFNIDNRKIHVLYWPIVFDHLDSPLADHFIEKRYFLSIGTGEPRKNVEFLIKNWKYLTDNDYDLLLFGKEWKKGCHRDLQALIDENGEHDKIRLVGMVTDEELERLYRNAIAFIFPSLEEGFGLPPLEALSNGIPVILPKTPINYELYGGIGAFYSLGDITELKQCIIQSQKECGTNKNRYINYCKRFDIENFKSNISKIFG